MLYDVCSNHGKSGMRVWRLARHRVSIVLFTEVLCRIRSDLLYVGRGELRRDQHTIVVQAGRMRNAKRWHWRSQTECDSARGTDSVPKCGIW